LRKESITIPTLPTNLDQSANLNPWHNGQAVFDRLFPYISGLFLILIFSGIVWLLQTTPPAITDETVTVTSLDPSIRTTPTPSLINLKTATVAELDRLPGIGPKKAADIVALREEAKIQSVEDLKLVKGISEKLFGEIEPQLTWE
jgi:competence ComEA-like helix-hairpin-helix protein